MTPCVSSSSACDSSATWCFTTPLIRALKRTFPDATPHLSGRARRGPVVAGNPHLDEVIVVARSRGLARLADDLRLAWRLRRERFDVVIDLHGGPRSSWLTLATGAPQRIGYDIPGRRWLYTRTVARAARAAAAALRRQPVGPAAARSTAGRATPPDPARDAVEMPLDAGGRPPHRRAAARRRRRRRSTTLIVVHVSAGNPFRRWPEAAFVRPGRRPRARRTGRGASS